MAGRLIKKGIAAFFLAVLTLAAETGYAQTQQVLHDVPFTSGKQNMWGESWNAFSIDMDYALFDESWNIPFQFGKMSNVLGYQFGADVEGSFSGRVGAIFSLTGFTTGEVQVDYPVDITLTMPADTSYDQGDWVEVETEYEVAAGYALETFYPSAGEAKLSTFMKFGAGLDIDLCVFACVSFPLIPQFNLDLNVDIFRVDANGIDIFDISLNGIGIPGYDPYESVDLLPYTTPQKYGLSGTIDLPYVTTTDQLNGYDLEACGDYEYASIDFDIFSFIRDLNIPKVSQVLGALSGSHTEGFGPYSVSIKWNFFSAGFKVAVINNQCFDFKPKVWGKFDFPLPVEYEILSSTGSVVSTGLAAIINVEVGNRFRYKFPCHFEELNIIPTYTVEGRFTNHTYDEIAFSFTMSAFEFGIEIPRVTVVPEICVPEICFRIPYPCPSWTNPFRWCRKRVCTPAFCTPEIYVPGLSESFGPLWRKTIPIASVSYDWFRHTWTLEGFAPHTKPAFTMKARKLRVTKNHSDVLCHGDATGTINLNLFAVTPALPYTFAWSNGATTQNIGNLPAGPYEVTIYDNNGCSLFTGATVMEPENPLATALHKTDKSCGGGANDGQVDLAVRGGTAPYTYSWNGGVATTQNIIALDTGRYDVRIIDDNGCVAMDTIDISAPIALTHQVKVTAARCHSDSSGAISLTPSGGIAPYTYAWSGGQVSRDILDVPAGSYSFTITDANNCVENGTYIIMEPAQSLDATAVAIPVDCKGNASGGIDISTIGGTPGYSYQWQNARNVLLPHATEDISGIKAGTYNLLVTDANGCTKTLSVAVDEPVAVLASTPAIQDVDCNGAATGFIHPQVSGGTGPHNYNWNNGVLLMDNDNIPAGTYELSVMDANGCVENFEYTVKEPLSALALQLDSVNVFCHGENSGRANAISSGGTAPYVYSWSNGVGSATLDSVTAGNYTLTVTDAKNCTVTGGVNITEPLAALSHADVITDVDCHGNESGEIELNMIGGTSPYYIVWNNQNSLVLADTSANLVQLPAGTYRAEIRDANGCPYTYSAVVGQPVAALQLSSDITDNLCFAASAGDVDLHITGGTAPYVTSWSNGAGTEDVHNLVSGTYTVVVTDHNGCTDSSSYRIGEPDAPLAASVSTKSVSCYGANDGELYSKVSGGTLPYSYLWSSGDTLSEIVGVVSATYTLTVTDGNGCTAVTGSHVSQPAQPLTVLPVVNDVSCTGGSDGEITISISGGTAPYYYNWGDQNQILVNNFTEVFPSLAANSYLVRVTDRNGCRNEQVVVVGQPPLMEVQSVIHDVLCYADSTGSIELVITGGTPAYTLNWNNGQTGQNPINLWAGTHEVEIVDALQCRYVYEYEVMQPAEVNIGYEIHEISCIDEADGAILTIAHGGVSPYSYQWTNGEVEQDIVGLAPGHYGLQLTDAHGCVSVYDFDLVAPSIPCVQIPNTITPNGDNYNDTWILDGIELYPGASVKVFNNWGNLVYESDGAYTPWDGTHNGRALPAAVYYYIIKLGNPENNEYNGTITIIR